MGIKIINAKELAKNQEKEVHQEEPAPIKLQATINESGYLQFENDTARALDLRSISAAKFAHDEQHNDVLYIILCKNADDETFDIRNIFGDYYVLSQLLFDNLKLPYKEMIIEYELKKEDNPDGLNIYKLEKANERTRPKNKMPLSK